MKAFFAGDLPKLIMFDLDGTLVDSVPDLSSAVQKMLAAMGLPLSNEDQVRVWVGNGAHQLVKRALVFAAPERAEALFDEAFSLFMAFYAQGVAVDSCLYPDVKETLSVLHQQGITLAVVTNKPECFTYPLLKYLGIEEYFAYVLGGDSLAEKKPHPLPLQHLFEKMGIRPNQALMVGDSVNDVQAARAAGCPVVAVPYGYNHGEPIESAKPDQVISSVSLLLRT